MGPVFLILFAFVGCGGDESAPPPAAPSPTPTPAPAEPPSSTEATGADPLPTDENADRYRAIAIAVGFVEAQGFTERPARVDDTTIVRDLAEHGASTADLLTARHASLAAWPVRAEREGASDTWLVAFPYASDPHRARAARVRFGPPETVELVHQDMVVPEPVVAEVVAELVRMTNSPVQCGTMHVAAAMEYRLVQHVSGAEVADPLIVVHGCPELTRERYNEGDLDAFRVGDRHRMRIERGIPLTPGGISVFDDLGHAGAPRWFARHTDRAR